MADGARAAAEREQARRRLVDPADMDMMQVDEEKELDELIYTAQDAAEELAQNAAQNAVQNAAP